ncbi:MULTISPECIES: hypothetical protein [unclassified Fibrobacter]|uniref:hypothetical protein n=1 Tax=unclassified Fibrobacter TaxID=2634177 RepID=UPI000D6CEF8A|nr:MULTISPECIES: hypothetical protein [unclassified Fibrobacter]PWJ59153.1 uncharacterized protein (TIGR02646 family) [Fibrobacter sp. UWR4]PZW63707.1 uncharacterized protein (TIGR02646 family) [Fibrobacter sp. UWR1]
MIPVTPKPEPSDFDEKVRQPGKKWLAKPQNANANPSSYENYWKECIPDLEREYDQICAYLGIFLERGKGSVSVDHFIPKSDPVMGKNLTYEWSNYRLCCRQVNSKKNEKILHLDPFTMQPNSFFINFSDGCIFANPQNKIDDEDYFNNCEDAIIKLKLNDKEFCCMRKTHYEDYILYNLPDAYMQKYSPFVWQEICRQGLKK